MNKLVKNIFIILFLLGAGASAHAQGGGRLPAFRRQNNALERPNRVKQLEKIKRGYISERLSLSAEQGNRFWPMYEQYQGELDGVLRLRMLNNRDPQPGADQFDKDLEYQQKITAIQKHYYEEFSKVLPPDKASQVFKSEREFKVELLRRLKENTVQSGPSADVQQEP